MYIHVNTMVVVRYYVLHILRGTCDGLANFIDHIAEHVSPRIAGRWDVQGAWCNRYRVESQINTSYLGDAREWQREHLRITSCLVCILWDCVARTRTSITRRPIRVVTQRVATFMTLTTLVI